MSMYSKLIEAYEFLKMHDGTITQEIEPGYTISMKRLTEEQKKEVEQTKDMISGKLD